MLDIASREALAVDTVLRAFRDLVKDSRVDVMIDNQAMTHAWNNQGGKSRDLKHNSGVVFTTAELNILLRMLYVPSQANPADAPARRLLSLDYMLAPKSGIKYSKSSGV